MSKMKQTIKTELNAKLAYWQSIKSPKMKVAIIISGIAVVALKVVTTVITAEWFIDLFD